ARAFLEASERHDPFAFDSMREITATIEGAIASGDAITVHGDYDCDGVSATAILVRALRELGAECDWFIPGRLEDGYGLTREGVARLAARGTRLLITVDCGITCPQEVASARAAGMDVIVTDHHEPSAELPDCPVLHPRLGAYPFGELCAAGVAYKLAAALLGAQAAEQDLDLVALATVADLVPLRGENRALVRKGLAIARSGRRPGLRARGAAADRDAASPASTCWGRSTPVPNISSATAAIGPRPVSRSAPSASMPSGRRSSRMPPPSWTAISSSPPSRSTRSSAARAWGTTSPSSSSASPRSGWGTPASACWCRRSAFGTFG